MAKFSALSLPAGSGTVWDIKSEPSGRGRTGASMNDSLPVTNFCRLEAKEDPAKPSGGSS